MMYVVEIDGTDYTLDTYQVLPEKTWGVRWRPSRRPVLPGQRDPAAQGPCFPDEETAVAEVMKYVGRERPEPRKSTWPGVR